MKQIINVLTYKAVKKHIVIATIFAFSSITVSAQQDHSNHQTPKSSAFDNKTATKPETGAGTTLSQLLASYYNIKNALVAEDAGSAATNALAFVKTINTIDYKVITEGNVHALGKAAGKISETRDIKKQREYFLNFSSNVAAMAKALKISDRPIYVQYCPMKKASWLSSEKEIRNPYYGSSMLTCGEVTQTL